jgi:ribosomal-protein-alanine N-acetyltransferase
MSAETRKARVPTFPVLETERLHLRAFADDDAPWYLEQFSRPETIEGQGYPAPDGIPGAIAEIHEYGIDIFDSGKGVRWAICLKQPDGRSSGPPIGSCVLLDWEDEPYSRAEVGYSLEPTHWGHGYATEALIAIQQFGFDQMGLDRIDALVWDRNERSMKVLERLGYVREELLPQHFEDSTGFFRDEWRFVLNHPAAQPESC